MGTRRPDILLLLLLVLLLARHAWLATYVNPYADDLNYAVVGQREGLMTQLGVEYRSWNGRWASNVAVLRGPLTWGEAGDLFWYRLMPVVFILLTALAAFVLLRTLFRDALDRLRTAIVALSFTAFYLHLMPHLGQGIFWYTGAVTYQLANVLMLFHMATVIVLLRPGAPRPGLILMSALSLLLASGFNEVAMVLLVVFHAVLLFIRWKSGAGVPVLSVAWLLIALGGAFVMATAPGNAVRADHFPARHDPFLTLAWSTLQTGRFGVIWIFAPAMLVTVLLALPWCRRLVERSEEFAALVAMHPHLWLAITFGMVFVVMVLPYWSTGLLGQHRTVNVALFFFIPLWFVTVASIDRAFSRGRAWTVPFAGPRARWIPLALLVAMLFYTGNDRRVSHDLIMGVAVRHDARMQERYSTVRTAMEEGRREVVVPAMLEVPASLGPLDAGPEPTHWINRSLAAWLGDEEFRITVAAGQ